MEKRKTIGLKSYFSGAILIAVFSVIAIIIAILFCFNLLINLGYVLPASTGEIAAKAAIQDLKAGNPPVNLDKQSVFDYIEFNSQNQPRRSSLSGWDRERLWKKYANKEAQYSTAAYVELSDGSYWLFTWDYRVHYANPNLQKKLPSVEFLFIFSTLSVLILFFLTYIHRMSRVFSSRLDVVKMASNQIASQELDSPIKTSSGLKEFDSALESLEQMRDALKTSLVEQWQAEQQRQVEIAALAHDIKTPLTVISGNAELLSEDLLPPAQASLVNSISASAKRAQQYIQLLQQISTEEQVEELIEVPLSQLMDELTASVSPLAHNKQVDLQILPDLASKRLLIYPSFLLRALINITENAIRYTPPAGRVQVDWQQKENKLAFVITDNGPGFSSNALLHATEIFWQDDKSRTSNGSYGMGLAIAAKAAKLHNGSLYLSNQPLGGCVTLEIDTLLGTTQAN